MLNYRNRQQILLSRIFGRKREEVVKGWKILQNVELHSLYASRNTIQVFISRSMTGMG
jgi:hypothetical protein